MLANYSVTNFKPWRFKKGVEEWATHIASCRLAHLRASM